MSSFDDGIEEQFYSPQVHSFDERSDSSFSPQHYPRTHSSISSHSMILQHNYSTHFIPLQNQTIELPEVITEDGTNVSLAVLDNLIEEAKPYPTKPCSITYRSYWLLIVAFFLLFTAYSLVQNLASSLFGDSGSVSIAIVYIFFVISSLVAPVALGFIFQDNATLMMFAGSLAYTLFTIFCIFGYPALLILGAAAVGLSAGPLWVSYSTAIASFARNFAEHDLIVFTRADLGEKQTKYREERRGKEEELWEQCQQRKKTNTHTIFNKSPSPPNTSSLSTLSTNNEPTSNQLPFSTYNFNDSTLCNEQLKLVQLSVDDQINALLLPNNRVNPNKLDIEQTNRLNASTNEIIGLLNSVGWACLNLDVVVGGLVSYFILNRSTTESPAPNNAPNNSTVINTSLENEFISPPSLLSSVFTLLTQTIQLESKSTHTTNISSLVSTSSAAPSSSSLFSTTFTSLSTSFSTLSGSSSSASNASDVNSRPLFIVLACTASIANILYFLAYFYSPISMFHVPQLDPKQNSKTLSTDTSSQSQSQSIPPLSTDTPIPQTNSSSPPSSQDQSSAQAHFDNQFNNNSHTTTPTTPQQLRTGTHRRSTDFQIHNYPDIVVTGSDIDLQSREPSYDEYIPSPTDKHLAANYETEFESPRVESPTQLTSQSHQTLSTQIPEKLQLEKTNPFFLVARSVYLMFHLSQQRIFFQSILSWFACAIPQSFFASLYTANYVKPILGTANITLIMMLIAATDALTALGISRIMKQLTHARYIAFCGSLIQLAMFIILILFCDPVGDADNQKKVWILSCVLAVVCGISDAMMQSGTNTAIGMIADGSVEVRGASFGFSSVVKSTGSIFVFLSTKVISFRTQIYTITVIIIVSLFAQVTNILFHKPIDVNFLQNKYDNFRCICSCTKQPKHQQQDEIEGTHLYDLQTHS